MPRRSVVGLILGLSVVFGLVGSADTPMPPGFFAAYHWQSNDPLFGGFSAIETDADGLGFVVVSDKSAYTTGRFTRDSTGRIASILAEKIALLHGPDNQPLPKYRKDTEGLALLPNGQAYISFERDARVAHYPTLNGPGIIIAGPPAFDTMRRNSSLEALAVDADGTLYTLPERSGDLLRPFPVYRFRGGVWDHPFSIPRIGTFLAVAADFGPDGRFYLLERQFRGLSGFASRVRRFEMGSNQLFNQETLFQSIPGQHDNLEGLSVWRDASGTLRLTMISDNNLLFLQRTEIVEYRVPD